MMEWSIIVFGAVLLLLLCTDQHRGRVTGHAGGGVGSAVRVDADGASLTSTNVTAALPGVAAGTGL
jgi:hypothetical protein